MPKRNPKQFFLILFGLVTLGTTGLIFATMKPSLLHAYLISVNVITFLAYGFDKHQAKVSKIRVPELVLHLLALAGGSVAAAVGQFAFRHKTQKTSFRVIYFLIVAAQAVLVVAFIYWAYKAS